MEYSGRYIISTEVRSKKFAENENIVYKICSKVERVYSLSQDRTLLYPWNYKNIKKILSFTDYGVDTFLELQTLSLMNSIQY